MNYAESFEQFATKLGPTDLALYAGAGLIIWVLFREKLSPVENFVLNLWNKGKGLVDKKSPVVAPVVPVVTTVKDEDVFFQLVVSWKQTRDLAVKSGCVEAVKVADQMFPYLSPNVCGKEKV